MEDKIEQQKKDTRPGAAWRRDNANFGKLREARRFARNHRQKAARDEFSILMTRAAYRRKVGIPVELPKLHPWDYAKGKVH